MEYNSSINKDNYVSASGSNETKELGNKIDLLLKGISHLTNLLERNLEEKRYAAVRERKRRW
jgi:hypothetical protein